MELWQLGALLGADLPHRDGIDHDLYEREKGTLVERAEAIRNMKTSSTSDGEPTDITADVMRQMGIRTE